MVANAHKNVLKECDEIKVCEEIFIKKSSVFNTFWLITGVILLIVSTSIAWAFSISKDVTTVQSEQVTQSKDIADLKSVYKDIDTVKDLIREQSRQIELNRIATGR